MITESILRTNIHTQWTLYGSIQDFGDYEKLIKALEDAQNGDSIELLINSPGGSVSTGMMIVQAIQRSKATVISNVVYPSYSMASLIACAGDYLLIQKHALLQEW